MVTQLLIMNLPEKLSLPIFLETFAGIIVIILILFSTFKYLSFKKVHIEGCTRSSYSKKKISMDPTTKWLCAKNSQAACQDIEAYKILIKRFKCKISFFEFGLCTLKEPFKKHIHTTRK